VSGNDQFTAVTPCRDWDLQALLNHMILWTAYSAEHRARDEPLPDDLMTRDFAAEPATPPRTRPSSGRAVAAWSEPAAWERDLNVMGSPTPAADVGALLLAEMVLHGWTSPGPAGRRYACAEPVANAVLAAVEANAELFRKYDVFADRSPCPRRRPPFERALALSGRDPRWKPAT